jgi:Zn-dependent protease
MDGLPVARIAGIEIRVSLAWVVLLAFVAYLGQEQAAAIHPDLPAAAEWAIGGGVAFGFLLSVLAHEFVHTVVARRRGVGVDRVVLGFLGGVAPFDSQGSTPRDELAIAVSGPLLSGVLGGLLVAIGLGLDRVGGATSAVGASVTVVGALNLALAALSLLPGLPLDGGRVVRALAWSHSGDPRRGSALATLFGRWSGWLLIGLGIWIALAQDPPTGLMILSLGWFVSTGAKAVERRLALETLLDGVVVREAMEHEVPQLPPQLTLDTFVDRYAVGERGVGGPTSLPVVAEERVLGIIGLDRVRRMSRRSWATTRAEDVMAVPPAAPYLGPDDPLWDALEAIRRADVDGLAVVRGGLLEGVLTRRGAMAAIRDRMRARAGVGTST